MANGLFAGIMWASQGISTEGIDSPIDGISLGLNTGSNAEINGYETAPDHSVVMKSGGALSWKDVIDYWQFDLSAAEGTAEGKLFWDADAQTLALGTPGGKVTLQIGQEMHVRAKNAESTTILNGTVVYIFSASGKQPQVKRAYNTDYNVTSVSFGLATEDIKPNQFGYITTLGIVRDFNTSHLTEGGVVWLDTTNGLLTSTRPTYPNNTMAMGVCLYSHAVEGMVYVSTTYIQRKFGTIPLGNYTSFNDNGHQTMFGSGRTWRDEVGDALTLKIQGTGLSTNTTEGTVDFSSNSDLNDYLFKNCQLNHDRDETSTIYPHIHFFQNQNVIPNFLLQYRWQVNDEAKTTAWTYLKCNTPITTYVSGTLHQVVHSSGIVPPAGSTLSDIVQFRIFRDNANASGLFTGADSYSGSVGIMSFDVHVQMNCLGSSEEYTK